MRVIMSTIGTAGDVHPFIAVGQTLRSRGHEVVVLTNEVFRARVETAGLGFRALADSEKYYSVIKNPNFAHHIKGLAFAFDHLIAGSVEPTVEKLGQLVREFKPDIIVRHHINFGAQWVADEHGVPTAVVVLAPVSWLSTEDPCVYGWIRVENSPRWWARLYKRMAKAIGRPIVDKRMNALARKLGHPERHDVFHHEVMGGRVNLALWSPHFRGPAKDDPAHGHICGFCYFDRDPAQEEDHDEIYRFVESGDPPVVFTLGSSVCHQPGRFYHVASAACRAVGRRALLLIGPPTPINKIPSSLPEGVAAFHYAPYSALLPRVAAIVHHGGVGTTAQAMRAGKPTVIVPFANDEFDNAARAKRLGVSASVNAPALSERRLTRALSEILGDAGVSARARELGALLQAEQGALNAALHIERAAGS